MGLSIPLLPGKTRASALLHGGPADFITNAYLALQRQWPDEGGFAHYMYALGQPGARRADVLREIANSENARQCGVVFIDDLPPEHDFQPEDHDSFRLIETSLNLRLARLAADVEQMRLAVGRLTADELAKAVEGIAQAQLVHQAVLESRLNTLARPDAAAEVEAAPTAPPATGAWRHLAAQQMAWLQPANDGQDDVSALQAEVAELRQEVQRLRDYTTVELKREVADYVNALHAAAGQGPSPTSPTATRRASVREAARARHGNVHPIERPSRTGT